MTPVTVIGCTGHQTLTPSTVDAVSLAMSDELADYDVATLVGLCSLAIGSDQLFAQTVLSLGGRLHAVVPCADYESTFSRPEDVATYFQLLDAAYLRTELDYPAPTDDAFMAGGRAVADGCDLLLAIWDGKPAGGLGGTADVVTYARTQGTPVVVIWPTGAARS
jgi:hypothetical protein